MARQIKHELVRWNLRIIDLEERIAEQRGRIESNGVGALDSLEVLHFMEQTLEDWRAHKRVLLCNSTFEVHEREGASTLI